MIVNIDSRRYGGDNPVTGGSRPFAAVWLLAGGFTRNSIPFFLRIIMLIVFAVMYDV